jgi:hypothetical protein
MELWNYVASQDSLVYFGSRRTDLSEGSKFQGVETPSQVRLTPNLLYACLDKSYTLVICY